MLGVFSQFERAIIRERINVGLARVKAQGKRLGRPRRDDLTAKIRKLRAKPMGIIAISKKLGCGVSLVRRVLSEAR